ncbi:MAG: hypothetical protein K0Q74_831 [Gammaproteobacteria bacterium]|nr:hypothetical protein [Gammaproteobacteria bacterium]
MVYIVCWQKRYTIYMERVMGIEPTLSAWEAEVLPLNYTRELAILARVS